MKMCEIPAFSLSGYFCALNNHLQSDGAELCTSKQLWIKKHLDFQMLWIKQHFVMILLFGGFLWKYYSIQNGTAHIDNIKIFVQMHRCSPEGHALIKSISKIIVCEVKDHSQFLSLKAKLIPVLTGLSGNTKSILAYTLFPPSTKL